MPTYEYECLACRQRFERKQSFSDEPVRICPSCGGEVRKVLHPPGIVFKGSGWYVTDSRKSTDSSESAAASAPASADGAGAGGEAKKGTGETGGASSASGSGGASGASGSGSSAKG